MRVPICLISTIEVSAPSGSAACALAQVSWLVLMTSSSKGMRSSADMRDDAVRQNASSRGSIRRSWSEVNFVGREKSTACTRRRPRAPALRLVGELAFARRVDERSDRVGAQDRRLAFMRLPPCPLYSAEVARPCPRLREQ